MKLILLVICVVVMMNIYYDGVIVERLKSFSKYYKMAGVAFAGLSIYLAMSKGYKDKREIVKSMTDMLSILPIDKDTREIFLPSLPVRASIVSRSGGNSSRRSVSETKKKFVAANQNWKCGKCGNQLSAWFEVDHRIGLGQGGSNHVENLVALCRECHGQKTAMDRIRGED